LSSYHGRGRHRAYFEGWYFKQQKGGITLSLIPGISMDGAGNKTAFIQVISHDGAFYIEYPFSTFRADEKRLDITVGGSRFASEGIHLDIRTRTLTAAGVLRFEALTPISYDIMGPFRFLPGMECSHGVISMRHRVTGEVRINGHTLGFDGGTGYIESDWGHSFPNSYLWTQCNTFDGRSTAVMASAADIPFGGLHFRGCICVVRDGEREYRLATYLGTGVSLYERDRLALEGPFCSFEARLLSGAPQLLRAPGSGAMSRGIHEHVACPVQYRFYIRDRLVFDLQSASASFEFDDKTDMSKGQGTQAGL